MKNRLPLWVSVLVVFGLIVYCAFCTSGSEQIYISEPTICIEQVTQLANHNFSYEKDVPLDEVEKIVAEISNYLIRLKEEKENLPLEAINHEQCAKIINNTYLELETFLSLYNSDLETLLAEKLRWQKKSNEYPVATQVWQYMKTNFGWSDIVCAGVMGNIMAEIGGGTLDFSNWNHNDGPYGMFQWLGQRKKDIKQIYGNKPSVEEQLEFMYDELYGTDGVRQQVEEWQRDKILNAKTCAKAAAYFCKYFERPGGKGTIRQSYAKIAYNYFTE